MAFTIPTDPKAISFSVCILINTYISFLTGTPPNPTPYDSTEPDRLSRAVTPRSLFIRRFIVVSLGVYHAVLCLAGPSPPRSICPNPSNLEPNLFSWTPYSIGCIAILLVGSYIRLSAFSTLGASFTFRLAAPKKLVTSGIYRYVQHPSYTGKILIILANGALIRNPYGVVGCWLPAWIVNATWFWRAFTCLLVLGVIRSARHRIQDEETMLKNTFGKEWEDWHAKTKRLVPGLF